MTSTVRSATDAPANRTASSSSAAFRLRHRCISSGCATRRLGYFFEVITNGYGLMYPYASRVPPADRWAIVAYIRALQLSQNATLADAEPAQRAKLEASTP